jgi:hypothetical protein
MLAVAKTVSKTAALSGFYIFAQFYLSYKLLLSAEFNNLPSLALVLARRKTSHTTNDYRSGSEPIRGVFSSV